MQFNYLKIFCIPHYFNYFKLIADILYRSAINNDFVLLLNLIFFITLNTNGPFIASLHCCQKCSVFTKTKEYILISVLAVFSVH